MPCNKRWNFLVVAATRTMIGPPEFQNTTHTHCLTADCLPAYQPTSLPAYLYPGHLPVSQCRCYQPREARRKPKWGLTWAPLSSSLNACCAGRRVNFTLHPDPYPHPRPPFPIAHSTPYNSNLDLTCQLPKLRGPTSRCYLHVRVHVLLTQLGRGANNPHGPVLYIQDPALRRLCLSELLDTARPTLAY